MIGVDFSAPFERLVPGEGFRSRGRTITETDVVSFAALTGDNHPQHTDAEWSRRSRFGERIAHGMLIVSYATGLVPFDPDRVVALRRIHNVVFKAPVRLGETIHVEGTIAELTALPGDAGLVRWHWSVRSAADRLVCRAEVDVLWARESAPTRDPAAYPADLIGLPPGVLPC